MKTILLSTIAAVGVLLSGCSTPSTTPNSTATAAAKIGAVIQAVETPPIVQGEAQVLTAEILQRAVASNKQAVVAGWCTCIARGLEDFSGTTAPTAAQLTTLIQSEAGTVTDPEFPVVVAAVADFWTAIVIPNIPAGSTPAQVEAYVNAVATGVQNGSINYLK